eukprot:CAMPEP_0113666906 /NCGR_PEP_ID=MMETSP0038_2-20120614/3143_1 /TAXON_ID=2898 /ORGANISM="Cryptomonas paramecium" /LENGTH=127 /DNA_ID=CAMNT_0000582467 /DNA_START=299 /DNA_END=679 /DNA_ORIENTATION=+ /assembly_acc=CAM_ASM_000170
MLQGNFEEYQGHLGKRDAPENSSWPLQQSSWETEYAKFLQLEAQKRKKQGTHGKQDPRKARNAQMCKWGGGSSEGGQAQSLLQFLKDLEGEGIIKLRHDPSVIPHQIAGFVVNEIDVFRRRRNQWFC